MTREPVLVHLGELRGRLIVSGTVLVGLFLVAVGFSPWVLERLLQDFSLAGVEYASLSPLEVFHTQLRVAFLLALALSVPVIFYQLIMFVRPALRKYEREALYYIMPAALLLFIAGCVFSYLFLVGKGLSFFAGLAGLVSITNVWSIRAVVSFVVGLVLVGGLVLEVPLLLAVLSRLGVLNQQRMIQARPFVYVTIFLGAALFTPPDIITQLIVGGVLVLGFEVSLLFS